jgi:hypothetical protein
LNHWQWGHCCCLIVAFGVLQAPLALNSAMEDSIDMYTHYVEWWAVHALMVAYIA